MRKRIVGQNRKNNSAQTHQWLHIETIAEAELTSEATEFPIESALLVDSDSYWQAAESGEQSITLVFDEPQQLECIRLLFQREQMLTQEFLLCWSADHGKTYQDIARQQFNFSSPNATEELEEYHVNLKGVTALKLSIIPDISGGDAHATLMQWYIA
ncbi:MAG: hypothetical protein Q9M31_03705 [Mariprofundus sp.]|nr:hypothetical protein [Mariprofundus sp.]